MVTLKINKNARYGKWKIWSIYAICLIQCTVTLFLGRHRYHELAGRRYGDVINDLLQDVKKAFPPPAPFKSSWLDHPLLISGCSQRTSSMTTTLNIYETFMILFNFKLFLVFWCKFFTCLVLSSFEKMDLYVKECIANRLRVVVYVIFVLLFSYFLVLATDGALGLSYHLMQDNIVKFLNSSIVHVGPADMKMDRLGEKTPHPFTSGKSNPFFLEQKFRYIGEDVQFVCDYTVFGEAGVKPIFRSSWWNKNGFPVEHNDRLSVNVSIQPINLSEDIFTPFEIPLFTVRNTLTINMVDTNDYGRYTCIYDNPLLLTIIVKYYFENNEHESDIPIPPSPPMSPSPGCDCKPQPEPGEGNNDLINEKVEECFAEFKLMPRQPEREEFGVDVNVGSILIASFGYVTQADASDVSVGFTSPGSSSTECCSVVSKLYWIFYRGGGFLTFPFSRVAWSDDSTNVLYFANWLCVCRDSPEILRPSVYRRFFNSTLNLWSTIDIDYPISIVLQINKNETLPFLKSLQFCDNSGSILCYVLEMILENRLYTVYGFDIGIILINLIIIAFLCNIFTLSRTSLVIPFRKSCFGLFLHPPVQFEAVQGPRVALKKRARFRLNKKQTTKREDNRQYDIYISYCQEDTFDTAVAQHFKKRLLDMGLTVFDPKEDILPGHPLLQEIHAAIHNSSRFLAFASRAFEGDHKNCMEFDAINDDIKSQGTDPKSRLLIVRLGQCEIHGLHRVPCISIPNTDREAFQLDEHNIYRFKEWEMATRPSRNGMSPTHGLCTQLRLYGFGWKSVIIILLQMYFVAHSFLFHHEENMHLTNETELMDQYE